MPKADLNLVLAGIEFLITAFGLLALVLRGWHKYYKAMVVYLGFRLVCSISVMPIFEQAMRHASGGDQHRIMIIFWLVYIASLGLVFAIYGSILDSVFSALNNSPLRGRLGLLWLLSLFGVTLFTLSVRVIGNADMATAFQRYFMQSVSILELGMFAFLAIGRRALSITMKDLRFGIALGFAIMAVINLLQTGNGMRILVGGVRLEAIYHLLGIAALGVWAGYAMQPLKRREPVLLPLRTMLKRWNEIATAMGHQETHVVQPRQAGLLKDVEQIVDRAFQENYK